MRRYSITRWASVAAAAICLLLGYILIGRWLALLAVPAMILLRIAAGRRSSFWAASGLLSVCVVLAVAGILLHASALLMSAGCVFALAGWDLSDPRGQTAAPAAGNYGVLLEEKRLRSLAAVLGASALLALLPAILRIQLPFGVVVFLALLLAGCILYAVHYLRASVSERP